MDSTILLTAINLVLSPLIAYWVASGTQRTRREIKEVEFLKGRILKLEQEVKELRKGEEIRNKNYFDLFNEHNDLKIKYEVLLKDYEDLKEMYDRTANELEALKKELGEKAKQMKEAIL